MNAVRKREQRLVDSRKRPNGRPKSHAGSIIGGSFIAGAPSSVERKDTRGSEYFGKSENKKPRNPNLTRTGAAANL